MWKFVVVTLLVDVPIVAFSSLAQNKLAPVLNKSPKHFVEFRVCKSANIHRSITLIADVNYYASNPICNLIANKFEGASYPRVKSYFHKRILPVNTRCASMKISIDELYPGYCAWKPTSLGYRFRSLRKDQQLAGSFEIKNNQHCHQRYMVDFWVNQNLKILDLNNHSTSDSIGLNCASVYHINIRMKKNVNHT